MIETSEDDKQFLNGAYFSKDSAGKITVSIPIKFRRQHDRKLISFPQAVKEDNLNSWNTEITPFQKALAQGHLWMRMINSGEVKTLNEIAKKENLDKRYVSRLTNLTMLSPELIEAILNDEIPDHISLLELGMNPPLLWCEQNEQFLD